MKEELLKIINNNDDFWKMVDYINWYNITNFGKTNGTSYHMYIARKKFKIFMNKKIRIEKLNKVNSKIFKSQDDIFIYYKLTYDKILKMTHDYFYDLWLTGKLNVSDDGYWDLLSSVIGLGKDFIINCIKDENVLIKMADDDYYSENFSYIFKVDEKEYLELKEKYNPFNMDVRKYNL